MLHNHPEPDLAALRHVFNDYRARSNMTYDDLAEATGISRRTLLNISSGTYNGDLRTWLILSRVWGTPLDAMMAPLWKTSV
ncbi:helix-turn-helix transcriptional regulator [Kocuria sp.]|uniref:helix-turn-helix transcriptional regulator n=1 Tax=Kocuria sp. TaxID=1871328 RepID=UPI0026E0E91D|nr:helix-turn-helix transcriptional regulator [Kocuria sp.]MDO5619749.1 helix-turn-helix transcriptional regulator [Kocuria sp.]